MRLLDLFSGAGGASEGYRRAGFEVTGVDIAPMPRYPFAFVQADALEYLAAHGAEYDAVHASPPCQNYSTLQFAPNRDMSAYPRLVKELRKMLIASGKPYIIENVPGAGLHTTIILCGTMFGLKVYRHRHFETSFMLFQPDHRKHAEKINQGGPGKRMAYYTSQAGSMATVAGHLFSLSAGSLAMNIDWMQKAELAESIPPAYTEYIGCELYRQLTGA